MRDTRSFFIAALVIVSGCHHEATTPSPTTVLTTSGGTVTITGQAPGQKPFVISGAEVRVRVDGQVLTTAGQSCQGTDTLTCAVGNGITLSLASQAHDGGLLLTATVTASGSHSVDGFELLDTHASTAALELPGTTNTLRYVHNGYQSWSFSGVLDVPGGMTLPRTGDIINYPAPDGAASVAETVGLSSHDAVISGGDGSAMVVGFVSAQLWQGAIALESTPGFKLTAQCGFTGDSVPLANGSVQSETLFVKYDVSPTAAMNDYGQVLAERQATRPQPPATAQRGWFSWNQFFDNITEPTVNAQATALQQLAGDGFKLIEIDDGWEQAWGDWTPNSKFDPVATLASTRHAAGQALGLWVAPFVVEQTQPIVTQHPDWWVMTASGQPLVHNPAASSHELMVVDTTNSEALAWAVGNLTSLQSVGVDFFKLDYLYATALDGVRSDPNATGVTALTLGLNAIFAAIGPASVNLCGAPWLHAMLAPASTLRIGADVSYSVGAAGFALVGESARNLSARAFGPLAHRSDPDQFWLSPLTTDERRTALTLQALSAETFSLADDLTMLSSDEQTLLSQAAALSVPTDPSTAFESRGLFDQAGTAVVAAIVDVIDGPDEVQTALPSVIVRGNYLAATNWTSSSAMVDLQLNKGEQVTPVWGPAPVGGHVQLDSHDTALYQLTTE